MNLPWYKNRKVLVYNHLGTITPQCCSFFRKCRRALAEYFSIVGSRFYFYNFRLIGSLWKFRSVYTYVENSLVPCSFDKPYNYGSYQPYNQHQHDLPLLFSLLWTQHLYKHLYTAFEASTAKGKRKQTYANSCPGTQGYSVYSPTPVR